MDIHIKESIYEKPPVTITGGTPSPSDYQDRMEAYSVGEIRNEVRSIAVDEKNIYLYNSSEHQTITIPRPK